MTPEQVLDKKIMVYCGEHGAMCFHANVGKVKFFDEKQNKYRLFSTGLPPGFSDLIVIPKNKPTFYCETKIHPRKPTQEQLDFIANLQKNGHLAFVCYTIEEFIEKTKNAL